jgi:hypothetical protein
VDGQGQPGAVTSNDLEMKACGPKEDEPDYEVRTSKDDHPTPNPPVDKALIYVIRPTTYAYRVQSKLAVDSEWKGVNLAKNYFYFFLSPGEHLFCSVALKRGVLPFRVEAGKAYYLQQHMRTRITGVEAKLTVISEDEGKRKLAKARWSVWESK